MRCNSTGCAVGINFFNSIDRSVRNTCDRIAGIIVLWNRNIQSILVIGRVIITGINRNSLIAAVLILNRILPQVNVTTACISRCGKRYSKRIVRKITGRT